MLESAPAHLQGVANVGQIGLVSLNELIAQPLRHRVKRCARSRRQYQQLVAARSLRRRGRWRLFEHDMRIGTTDTETANPRATRKTSGLPGFGLGAEIEGRLSKLEPRIGRFKMQGAGDSFVMQR